MSATGRRHYHITDETYLTISGQDELISVRSANNGRLVSVQSKHIDSYITALRSLRAGLVTNDARQNEACETCAGLRDDEQHTLRQKLRRQWLSQRQVDEASCDFCHAVEGNVILDFMQQNDAKRIIASCALGNGCRT